MVPALQDSVVLRQDKVIPHAVGFDGAAVGIFAFTTADGVSTFLRIVESNVPKDTE